MYIFTKSDNITTACKDIQLCSYFTLFMSIPSTTTTKMWSKDQVLDSTFIQNIVHQHIPEGLDAQVDCWRVHFRLDSDNCIFLLAIEYRVCLFGLGLPITTANAAHYKCLIENEIQRKTVGTKNGSWCPSNVIPRILV